MIGRISREDARRPAFNLEWNRCLPVSGLLGAPWTVSNKYLWIKHWWNCMYLCILGSQQFREAISHDLRCLWLILKALLPLIWGEDSWPLISISRFCSLGWCVQTCPLGVTILTLWHQCTCWSSDPDLPENNFRRQYFQGTKHLWKAQHLLSVRFRWPYSHDLGSLEATAHILHQKGCTAPRAVWCAQLSGLRVIRRDCPRHVSRLPRRFQGQTRVTRASSWDF